MLFQIKNSNQISLHFDVSLNYNVESTDIKQIKVLTGNEKLLMEVMVFHYSRREQVATAYYFQMKKFFK